MLGIYLCGRVDPNLISGRVRYLRSIGLRFETREELVYDMGIQIKSK